MTVTPRDIVIAVIFLVLGWVLNTLWDIVCEWAANTFDAGRGLLYDALALTGAVAIAVGIGIWLT